jgi:hypothetical protein
MSHKNLETAKLENKNNFDKKIFIPEFEIRTQMLVNDESVRRSRSKKLHVEASYIGPYEIIRVEGPNLVLRTRKGKEMKIHANRAKVFFT